MSEGVYSIGDRLDDMGVTAPLDRNDLITEVMVIAKVEKADGTLELGIYTATRSGLPAKSDLLHAAREILEATPPMATEDD